jgi:hypothetical protein
MERLRQALIEEQEAQRRQAGIGVVVCCCLIQPWQRSMVVLIGAAVGLVVWIVFLRQAAGSVAWEFFLYLLSCLAAAFCAAIHSKTQLGPAMR